MKKLLFLFAIAAFLGACEKDDPPAEFQADPSSDAGNMLIVNSSNKQLVLYKEGVPIKKIPNSSSDYLVNISTQEGQATEFSLYDWEDVKGDINNPLPDDVFKKWRVALSTSTVVSERVTWHVSASTEYSNMATIYFNYYAGTDYSVDVFLNGRTGAKLMTLSPGQQYRKIGLDYGNHTLAYRYWYSDQGNADGEEEIGWVESHTINGEENDIWLVLNESRSDVTMIVPHNDAQVGEQFLYGNLEVENRTGEPVVIHANSQLIENIIYFPDGNAKNLSTIDHAGKETYVIPIVPASEEAENQNGEEQAPQSVSINLMAKNLSGETVKEETLEITVGETVKWLLE